MPAYVATPAVLQSLIDMAQPGSTILLTADTPYVGPLVIRPLPGYARRDIRLLGMGDATSKATITIPPGSNRGVMVNHGVSGVTIENIRITGENVRTMIAISNDSDAGQATLLSQLPRDVTLRNCTISGAGESHRGIAADGINVLIENCIIEGFRMKNSESYAIQTFNTPGPVVIRGCQIDAAGINVFLGGDDPKIEGLVNGGVTIEDCTITKHVTYRGQGYTVKHHIEIKHGRNVRIRHNRFVNNWAGEGVGLASAVFLKPSMVQAKQTTVANVTIEDNEIRSVPNALRFAVGDAPSGMRNIIVRGNTCRVDRSLLSEITGSNCHVHFHTAVPDWWIEGMVFEDNMFLGEMTRDVWVEYDAGATKPFIRNLQWRRNVMQPGTFPSRPSLNDVSMASEIEL
jgi:hypothetical protein